MRHENDPHKKSCWYFKGDELLAVDAVNNPKAYVLGTKFIKNKSLVNREMLQDPSIEIKDVAQTSQT